MHRRGNRPGGIKVRFKIRIATGKRAQVIDARQAAVIMEVPQWQRQRGSTSLRPACGRAPAGLARGSWCRSRSWAGPRPRTCRTRGPRCPGSSAPPRAWLPAGWFLVAYYWDVESGGLDLEARGRGQAWRAFAFPRTCPATAAWPPCSPRPPTGTPRFAAVICEEDIERSGRDTFNALKLEKKLGRAGIALFATDEPAVTEGVNSTTVLVRRMKQSVAEWLRLQIKEKTWKGLAEHALDGWNIGTAAYGYQADRIAHPVPVKASQGRTKTRLALDPVPGLGHRPGLHLAGGAQARHPRHHRPPQRLPGPEPGPGRERVDRPDRLGHPG